MCMRGKARQDDAIAGLWVKEMVRGDGGEIVGVVREGVGMQMADGKSRIAVDLYEMLDLGLNRIMNAQQYIEMLKS